MKLFSIIIAAIILSGCAVHKTTIPIEKYESNSKYWSSYYPASKSITPTLAYYGLVRVAGTKENCMKGIENSLANNPLNIPIKNYPYVEDAIVVAYNASIKNYLSNFEECVAEQERIIVARIVADEKKRKEENERLLRINEEKERKRSQALYARESKIKELKVQSVSWRRGGFNTVLIVDLRIVNGDTKPHSNIIVSCYGYADNGTPLALLRKVLYKDFPVNSRQSVNGFNMGFLHSQVTKVACTS